MDTARYVVAIVVLVSFTPAVAFWPPAHRYIRFWRRLGPGKSYTILFAGMAVVGVLVYLLSRLVLVVEFGTNPWLIALAVVVYAVAAVIEIKCRKHLSAKTMMGFPEFDPKPENQKLLRDGIYTKVRHPRYLGFILILVAMALFTNYLAVYLFMPVFILAIYWVTVLEERELLDRFGEEYEEYRAQVPRLVPKLRAWQRSS